MNRKLVLSALLLITAIACIGLGVVLFLRSLSESSSLFTTAVETLQDSNDFYQYLSMIGVGLGVAILVFLKKYWR